MSSLVPPRLSWSYRPSVFFRWRVALTAAAGLFLGLIPVVVFSFGVFLGPIARDFNAGRGDVSFAYTLFSLIQAMSIPFAGWLMDRFGARKLILPSMVLASFVLLLSPFCSGSLWQLYVFFGTLGFLAAGAGPVAFAKVISHWFDRRRGLALGVMMLGLGLGAFVMPSLAQLLIARFGWRLAYAAVGSSILLVSTPLVVKFLNERPESLGLVPDGGISPHPAARTEPQNQALGVTWREALRTPTFWLLLSSFALVAAATQACFAHMAAIVSDRGSNAQLAAMASSLLGGGLLMGRTGSGYLLDRFFAPRVAALIFTGAAAGIALLRIAYSPGPAFAAAFLIGLAIGAEGDVMPYLTSRYFGLRCFGEICGIVFAGFSLAGGLGPYLMGAAYDAKGSYDLPLVLFCIAVLIAAALMLVAGPYRYGAMPVVDARVDEETLESPFPA
jgi:MFS family permease